jgi:lysozyme
VGWVARRWTHAVFVLAVSTTAVLTTSGTVPASARLRVPGIDVSKYQGRIHWPAVASTPVRFVIIRATKGNRYRDGRYARNLLGATQNGLAVGAYHYAKPSSARWDARAEADHFLRVARVAAGDVVPVLDIEEAGGLSSGQLRVWARAWLERVEARTGVRAMIYSGVHFWQGFMRNTSSFARRGHQLWVAHWYVRAPEIPGRRWGGKGFTVWQWSASGKVDGIKGDVDRDRLNGPLTRGTIASLTLVPAEGGLVSGARVTCGGPHSRCFRLANPEDMITLKATPDRDAHLVRWTGACAEAGDARTCTVNAVGARTVSAVFARTVEVAVPRPEASIRAGSGLARPRVGA